MTKFAGNCKDNCVESVQIRSFSGPYFPAFGLNTERYGASLCIQSKCGKIRTRKNSASEHFSCSDHKASFEQLLRIDNSISVYYKKLKWVTIELYRIFNGKFPAILKYVFPINTCSNNNIKNRSALYLWLLISVYAGTGLLSHLAAKEIAICS